MLLARAVNYGETPLDGQGWHSYHKGGQGQVSARHGSGDLCRLAHTLSKGDATCGHASVLAQCNLVVNRGWTSSACRMACQPLSIHDASNSGVRMRLQPFGLSRLGNMFLIAVPSFCFPSFPRQWFLWIRLWDALRKRDFIFEMHSWLTRNFELLCADITG